MKTFYQELFEYSHQMNQKLIHTFSEHSDKVSEKSVKWMSHMLNAHQLWNNRLNRQGEDFGVWQVHALGALKDLDLANHNRTMEILDLIDLEKNVDYVNSVGKAYNNSAKDILFHMVNHSTYHRGQIASDFRESGLDPLVTDYIAFKR